jgi:hypothetical protein
MSMSRRQLLSPSKGVRSLSLLAGYIAGEIFSVYAIFIAHTMNPVSYRLVQDNLKLSAIYGRYQELCDLDGLALTLAASCVVGAMAWLTVRGIASTMLPQIVSGVIPNARIE